MSYGNQSNSAIRNFNNYERRYDWNNQNTSYKNRYTIYKERKRENRSYNTYASTSSRPSPTCNYCELRGHMKVDCRKRINDLKPLRFQKKTKMIGELEKGATFKK